MYQIYQKVPKTQEYIYGSKILNNEENPFIDSPCLLCISPQHDNYRIKLANKSNFGVTKEAMKMARIRVRNYKNAGFYLENFPVKFLSMQLDDRDETDILTPDERIEKFVEKYFFPLISKDNKKIEIIEAMKNMRNVNLMSYCDGTEFVQKIENILLNKMKELGYSNEECEQIQSQMCMFPIATNRLEKKQKSTCISFKDINDDEVNDNVTEEEKEIVKKSTIEEALIKHSNNEYEYLFNGDGNHKLKNYTIIDRIMPVFLSSVITKALENSIRNFSNSDFLPISAEMLTEDFEKIIESSKNGKNPEELMQELDKNLQYGGAKHLSDKEIELLDKLDESYDIQIKLQQELERIKQKSVLSSAIQATQIHTRQSQIEQQTRNLLDIEQTKDIEKTSEIVKE